MNDLSFCIYCYGFSVFCQRLAKKRSENPDLIVRLYGDRRHHHINQLGLLPECFNHLLDGDRRSG